MSPPKWGGGVLCGHVGTNKAMGVGRLRIRRKSDPVRKGGGGGDFGVQRCTLKSLSDLGFDPDPLPLLERKGRGSVGKEGL